MLYHLLLKEYVHEYIKTKFQDIKSVVLVSIGVNAQDRYIGNPGAYLEKPNAYGDDCFAAFAP